MAITMTQHGSVRANQRGFDRASIELLREYGSIINDRTATVFAMTDRDVEDAISDLKRKIQKVEKLRRCKAVFVADNLLTVHHSTRAAWKRLTRR